MKELNLVKRYSVVITLIILGIGMAVIGICGLSKIVDKSITNTTLIIGSILLTSVGFSLIMTCVAMLFRLSGIKEEYKDQCNEALYFPIVKQYIKEKFDYDDDNAIIVWENGKVRVAPKNIQDFKITLTIEDRGDNNE